MIRAVVLAAAILSGASAAAQKPPGEPASFAELPEFAADDSAAAFAAFRASCLALRDGTKPRRAAEATPPRLEPICRRALALAAPVADRDARAFLTNAFEVRRLTTTAFLTGYYEPVVDGSPIRTAAFTAPLFAPPWNLVAVTPGTPGLDPALGAALRRPDGSLAPLPDRAAIEAGALGAAAPPLVWLREPVDAFFVAVQGSARVRLPDGSLKRVGYAGRNGWPYTSIGKLLVSQLGVAPSAMGMAPLRAWIRAHGQSPGEAGRALMDRNRSMIFFRFDDSLPPDVGPIGASGVSLTPLRSLAVDRALWAYGLPVYVSADLPWQGEATTPFRRLMVTQDTGSAIVGPARADIFFGTGDEAAARAGTIRHPGTLWVLWPKPEAAPSARSDALPGAPKRDAAR